jgi:hypothetical protein
MKAEPISTGILKLLPISIFFLLGTLVIALLFWLVWLRTKSAPTVSPNDSESDGFARNLMEALAREAAKKLNLAETELSRALWNCRHGKPAGDVLTAPLRVECTLTKSAANRIDACCKRRLKSAAGGARKVLHLPGKADWICRFSSSS